MSDSLVIARPVEYYTVLIFSQYLTSCYPERKFFRIATGFLSGNEEFFGQGKQAIMRRRIFTQVYDCNEHKISF